MPAPSEANLVAEVSCKKIQKFDNGKQYTVGLLDCGEKLRILHDLSQHFNVIMYPYDTPADVITEDRIDGILVSNGPGDPMHKAIVAGPAKTVGILAEQVPLFGICFGNQVTAIGLGGKTYKMKFGHRGCNQPVMYNGKVYITSQNHGFSVDEDSLKGTGLIADQFNINDKTVEGMKYKDLPVFTSQYHPEANPGPMDTSFLFERFAKIVKEAKQ
ncbi:Carbamoylphosphate synthase small subunit [Thermoplasmatales archaeon BRNA1]|nr:Carbamoylphosphate synthase small subunit [Thermoplasmatales archaeon BRNA1]